MIRRKNNSFIIILILFVGIGIGYAILNSNLIINGSSIIKENTWNIFIDKLFIKDGSVDAIKEPTGNSTSLYFEVGLDEPGDYYGFTFDIVNNGTIDAMIQEIKTDFNISEELAKCIEVDFSYVNDIEIESNQLLKSNGFLRYKFLVRYKTDVEVDDLPNNDIFFNVSINIIYTQANDNYVEVLDNGVKKSELYIINGDLLTSGSEFCIENECFYVLGIGDDDRIGVMSKYNLNIGNYTTGINDRDEFIYEPLKKQVIRQSLLSKGLRMNYENDDFNFPIYGGYAFSRSGVTSYYKSDIKKVVDEYADYIDSLGYSTYYTGLIYPYILEHAGCDLENNTCANTVYTPLFSTSHWIDLGIDGKTYAMRSDGSIVEVDPKNENLFGVRPVFSFDKDVLMNN